MRALAAEGILCAVTTVTSDKNVGAERQRFTDGATRGVDDISRSMAMSVPNVYPASSPSASKAYVRE